LSQIAVDELTSLPPRIAFVFEPEKAEECYALAEELSEEILGIGFFDKADPDEAVLLAETPQQYQQISTSA